MPEYSRVLLPGETVSRLIVFPTSGLPTPTRNALDQPYATSAHVNQPVGSGATRGASGLGAPTGGGGKLKVDPILLSTGVGGVSKTLTGINFYYNNSPNPGTKHTIAKAPSIPSVTLKVTDDLLHDGFMNGLFCAPESTGRYVYGGQALYRLTAADNPSIAFYGIRGVDIYGDGRPASLSAGHQGHGGSGLPIFGMTLRAAEFEGAPSLTAALTGAYSPQHVLALNLAGKWLSKKAPDGSTSSSLGGWKEPADRADGGFDQSTSNNYYSGSNVSMRMGTLLALPSTYDFSAKGITNSDAALLGWTMKYFGIRIVDVTGITDVYSISAQSSLTTLIANKPTAFHTQMLQMIQDCEVITNDGIGQWGGPGTRLVPAPPELPTPP